MTFFQRTSVLLNPVQFLNIYVISAFAANGDEGPEARWKYRSTFSLTSAVDRGGWQTPRPCHFIPGKKTRYQFYRKMGGPQGRFERVRRISPPPGCDPRTDQQVSESDCRQEWLQSRQQTDKLSERRKEQVKWPSVLEGGLQLPTTAQRIKFAAL